MWPFRKNNKKKAPQRRSEARLGGAAAAPTWWRRFRQGGGVGSVLMAAVFLSAVLVMDVWPLEPLPYRANGHVDRDVFARVTFQVESPAKTDQEQEAAAKRTPAVIRLDERVLQRVVAELKGLPAALKSTTQPGQLDEKLRAAFALKTPRDLADFARLAEPKAAEAYNAQIDLLAENLQASHLLTGADYSKAYHEKDAEGARVVGGAVVGLRPRSKLISLDNSRGVDAFLASASAPVNPPVRDNVLHYLQQTFVGETALYRLDARATDVAEDAARAAVPPATEPRFARSLLARRSTNRGLSGPQLGLLAAEHAEYLHQQNERHPWRRLWIFLGRGGMVGAVVLLLCLYVYKYQPSIVKNPLRAGTVAALLTLMLLLAKLMIGTGGWNPYLAAFCVFTAAAVLTIAFDQRFALAASAALAALTSLQLRVDLGTLLVLWAVASAAAFQLHEVRTRSKLIETGVVTAVAVFAGVWAVEAAAGVPVRFMLVDGGYAAAAALAGGFLTQGILPLIERIFRVATSLTLLEWCDANKPLLKRVALEAPGTYSHSLLLGTMSEAAAEAIAASGLLARVGAYYHDIGKVNKPDYFGENRSGPGSRHDKLSPAMSLLIIKGHVKDGLGMAKEYGLPRVLHEFIATHHGTTLVEYFYHAAAEQRKADAERAPDEVEFRYPGPKPRSKEAAVLMLADAGESSVRAMAEPTAGRIESQVHAVVTKRLMDGQLDECDLTLKEVHAIEGSLVKSLCGIHHVRVRYPSQEAAAPPENGEVPDEKRPLPASADAEADPQQK